MIVLIRLHFCAPLSLSLLSFLNNIRINLFGMQPPPHNCKNSWQTHFLLVKRHSIERTYPQYSAVDSHCTDIPWLFLDKLHTQHPSKSIMPICQSQKYEKEKGRQKIRFCPLRDRLRLDNGDWTYLIVIHTSHTCSNVLGAEKDDETCHIDPLIQTHTHTRSRISTQNETKNIYTNFLWAHHIDSHYLMRKAYVRIQEVKRKADGWRARNHHRHIFHIASNELVGRLKCII